MMAIGVYLLSLFYLNISLFSYNFYMKLIGELSDDSMEWGEECHVWKTNILRSIRNAIFCYAFVQF